MKTIIQLFIFLSLERMKIKFILIILVVFFIISSSFYYFDIQKTHNKIYELEKINKKIIYEKENLELNLFSKNKQNKPYTSESLYNEKGKRVDLKKIIGDKSKLIFRVSHKHCNLCYEAEFEIIFSSKNIIDLNNIIFLTSFSKRDFKVFVRNLIKKYGDNIKIFNNEKGDDMAPIFKEIITPYYFVLSKDGSVQSIFIPDKLIDSHTIKYFRSIDFID